MSQHSFDDSLPADAELRDVSQTLTGLPIPDDQLATQLQFVADLIADAAKLPPVPLLLWRDADQQCVRHVLIEKELVVGRQPGLPGLKLSGDDLLSRRHFIIRSEQGSFILEDLDSHNGTAVNRRDKRVKRQVLRDGDVILAGNGTFAFLDQSKTA